MNFLHLFCKHFTRFLRTGHQEAQNSIQLDIFWQRKKKRTKKKIRRKRKQNHFFPLFLWDTMMNKDHYKSWERRERKKSKSFMCKQKEGGKSKITKMNWIGHYFKKCQITFDLRLQLKHFRGGKFKRNFLTFTIYTYTEPCFPCRLLFTLKTGDKLQMHFENYYYRISFFFLLVF